MNKQILIITGPTAIGKTSYAIEQAIKLNGEIISADSMQVYRHMDIGTAKPTAEERAKVPHHLIDIIEPDQNFSIADFLKLFKEAKDQLEAKGKTVIVVGGTGFYLNALLKGLALPVAPPQPEIREQLIKEAEGKGPEYLFEKLKKLDSKITEKLHPNDQFRVIRALEVAIVTGKPMSAQQKKDTPIIGDNYRLLCLDAPREYIYERINQRVDQMFEAGLINEVQNLLSMGYNKNLSSLQALGYKETIEYLEGKYNMEELVELIKKRTRNFAKRQLTWFRSFENVEWVAVSG